MDSGLSTILLTGLHCFLSRASRSVNSYSKHFSVKSFDCVTPGVAAKYSGCAFISQCLILSLSTHGEIGITSLGSRNELLDSS